MSTQYAIHVLRPEGVLRIERVAEPIAVDAAEKANAEELETAEMRSIDPAWRWTGSPIPDIKPAYVSLHTSREGRIWVRVSQTGERIPEGEIVESL